MNHCQQEKKVFATVAQCCSDFFLMKRRFWRMAMYLRFQAFACVLEADLEHLEFEGQGLGVPSLAERHCWPVTLALIRGAATISR